MKQPKVSIHNTPADLYILAVRAAKKLVDKYPDRKGGVTNLVGIGFEDGSNFCVWWTKARNVSVYFEGTK